MSGEEDTVGQAQEPMKWTDLFGIAPDFTGRKTIEQFLEDSRGDA